MENSFYMARMHARTQPLYVLYVYIREPLVMIAAIQISGQLQWNRFPFSFARVRTLARLCSYRRATSLSTSLNLLQGITLSGRFASDNLPARRRLSVNRNVAVDRVDKRNRRGIPFRCRVTSSWGRACTKDTRNAFRCVMVYRPCSIYQRKLQRPQLPIEMQSMIKLTELPEDFSSHERSSLINEFIVNVSVIDEDSAACLDEPWIKLESIRKFSRNR